MFSLENDHGKLSATNARPSSSAPLFLHVNISTNRKKIVIYADCADRSGSVVPVNL